MDLAVLLKLELTGQDFRILRNRLLDFRLLRWPVPALFRMSFPRAVTLSRLATDLFVFIFGIYVPCKAQSDVVKDRLL